jgi:DNA-directed RNA polymerase specialized sigma24 family protein
MISVGSYHIVWTHRGLPKPGQEPAAFRGWVYQIAHDRAATTARRESRSAETLTVDVFRKVFWDHILS